MAIEELDYEWIKVGSSFFIIDQYKNDGYICIAPSGEKRFISMEQASEPVSISPASEILVKFSPRQRNYIDSKKSELKNLENSKLLLSHLQDTKLIYLNTESDYENIFLENSLKWETNQNGIGLANNSLNFGLKTKILIFDLDQKLMGFYIFDRYSQSDANRFQSELEQFIDLSNLDLPNLRTPGSGTGRTLNRDQLKSLLDTVILNLSAS